MPLDQFFQDKHSQRELKKFYKNAPRAFQRTTAGFLNRLAFDEYKNMQASIRGSMTIRADNLVKKLTRFKTTKKNLPISRQQTEAFTLTMRGHDGWEDQITGRASDSTVFTTAGRGGNEKKKSLPSARYERAFTGPQDFGFGNDMSYQDVVNYLQRISSSPQRRRKTWFLPVQFKSMPPGIYKFFGGRVRKPKASSVKTKRRLKSTLIGAKIKRLSDPTGGMRPEKNIWNVRATKKTLKLSNTQKAFQDNFDFELRKIRMRNRR
jgi:hypothetical protein